MCLDGMRRARIDPLGLKIEVLIERRMNETSIAHMPDGTGRGVTRVSFSGVKVVCSRCKLVVSGRYVKVMYILAPENDLWRTRLKRYGKKWGENRSNAVERNATIAHEEDHWNAWKDVESFIDRLNSLEGAFYFRCETKAAELMRELQFLIQRAKAETQRYDDSDTNQGGMNK